MTPRNSTIALLLISAIFKVLTVALSQQLPPLLYSDCVDNGTNPSTTYKSNLAALLSSIYTNLDVDYGFYNSSYGDQPTDKAYAIALCRPDVAPDVCRACIRNSGEALLSTCPNSKVAIGGYDDCMVRYSNRSIFDIMSDGPYFWVYNVNNVSGSGVSGFNQSLFGLLGSLNERAARGGSRYKYAAGSVTAPDMETIYALVQCTPDLSETQCRSCLDEASALIPACCTARKGGRVIFPSCNFRYEIGRFYGTLPEELAPSPSPLPAPASVDKAKGATPTPTPANNSAVRTSGKEFKAAGIAVVFGFAVALI